MTGSTKVARWAAAGFSIVYVVSSVAAVVVAAGNDRAGRASVPILIGTGFFVVVGAIILAKRNHPIGWLFCITGTLWATGTIAVEYSHLALVTEPGRYPGGWIGAWYGEWNWIAFWFATLVATPMLFPTGSALTPRWRLALRIILALAALVIVFAAMDPRLQVEPTNIEVDNPLGTSLGADPDDEGWLALLLFPLMFGGAFAAVTSMFLRFRRSSGEERLQLKWFTFAAIFLVGGFFALAALSLDTTGLGEVFYGIAIALAPVAAGIAISRYRLYDIDVLINRTLVYGVLTAVLAGLYLAGVVALQLILRPITSDSDLAVAASTLAVAGLFRPARARVQALIDRRFYRRKYDAVLSLERISARLRDEVDLDAVSGDVMAALAETMQPSHASLWLVVRR